MASSGSSPSSEGPGECDRRSPVKVAPGSEVFKTVNLDSGRLGEDRTQTITLDGYSSTTITKLDSW